MQATPKIYLDTRRSKSNSDKFPLKLKITFERNRKYYPINLYVSKEEFRLMENPALIPKNYPSKKLLKDWSLKCQAHFIKANKIIDETPDFTFRIFEKKFNRNNHRLDDVYAHYDERIKNLIEDGRINTASNYQCSQRSLQSFSPILKFKNVSAQFLKDYEKWFLGGGRSISTVGIYLRPLRAIFNSAIDEGIIPFENYPFGKRKYQIPGARNIKKTLTLEEIKRIYQYKGLEGSWHQKARDFFIFSYLCNGMNMKDIALLKFGNLEGDMIVFKRAKTVYTKRSGSKAISIPVHDEVNHIISRWASKRTEKDEYLFPILEKGITSKRESVLINQFTKMVNQYIRDIAKNLEIDKPISTYYARHSFATILKRSGASTEFIGESLGHSSTKTTLNYLDSFEDETKKEWAKVLTDF